ncbi:SCAN domain-containing protein 3 [Trichinella pseudospiralis]|uniref:SCAN domain-containing protein 3 n=1 Tax=Trichinella pseudospiralis TaxID=6337 RepID=A0A0V0XNI6_TRIPS|nr:SCAN domain-containing protein 3 [Trichinella pseudospiralis]
MYYALTVHPQCLADGLALWSMVKSTNQHLFLQWMHLCHSPAGFVNVEHFPHNVQEEAVELKFNKLTKDSFESTPLENFWVKLQAEYTKISSQSLRILVPFFSTYLCDTGLSALRTLNTYTAPQQVKR